MAVTHGLRRARLTREEDARRTELINELLAERGGAVDTLTRYYIEEYSMLTIHICRIDEYLSEVGTLTRAGRQPAAMTSRLALGARRDQVAVKIQGEALSETRTWKDLNGMTVAQLAKRAEELLAVIREATYDETHPAPVHRMPEPEDIEDLNDIEEPSDIEEGAPEPDDSDVELKERDLDAWRAIHYDDPDEVERRNAYATAQMHCMLQRRREEG